MYHITKKYTDFNGVEREQDFYFNLTSAECVDYQFGTEGTLSNMIETIIKKNDTPQSVKLFKEIILKAYGEKSDDGIHFNKSEKIRNDFESTQAFSDIYMELISDDKAASEFMNSVLPKDLDKYIEKMEKLNSKKVEKKNDND